MLIGLAVILFIIWIISFVVLHVTSGLIHLLLIVGVIVLIAHFFRGKRA